MQPEFDADVARRIGEAVREVEGRSAAELVVEVRARSGWYAHADARFAAALAFVSLIVLVFMPITVPPIAVPVDAFAFFFLGLAIARRSDGIRRLFTTAPERLVAVRTQAAALFHDRGIANTTGETGVVVYASLLERRMEVLADRGILQKVAANKWNAALAELHRDRPLGPEEVIAAVRRLGAILESALPAATDDVDELPNEVRLS
jgi:putative membrane protein